MTGLGTIIGELIGIEKGFEHFGEWLKKKTGNFLSPIMTEMAVVGTPEHI